MATTSSSDIKFPIRRAPPVPKHNDATTSKNSLQDLMTLGNDPFSMAPMRSDISNMAYMMERKKPPPRPPPPKINKNILNKQSGLSLFGRSSKTAVVRPQPAAPVPSVPLIDLSSPASSPTLNKPANLRYSSNSSLMESGFEDDFDPLGGNSRRTTPGSEWSTEGSIDSGILSPSRGLARISNDGSYGKQRNSPVSNNSCVNLPPGFVMPTIIRPAGWNLKPSRPPPPSNALPSSHDGSPPPPSLPAPPPPPSHLLAMPVKGPPVPPRPHHTSKSAVSSPHCVAEFDFTGETPEDLPFKIGDVITLEKELNDDWLEGSLRGKKGMFPANHVRIIIPLSGDSNIPPESTPMKATVIALYSYQPQSWDDLTFEEGDEIQVSRKINEDWLYGECNGRVGMFPSNFVQDITDFLS